MLEREKALRPAVERWRKIPRRTVWQSHRTLNVQCNRAVGSVSVYNRIVLFCFDFRLELLLQMANKIQNMAVDCEEKLTLAKNTLQSVSKPLCWGKSPTLHLSASVSSLWFATYNAPKNLVPWDLFLLATVPVRHILVVLLYRIPDVGLDSRKASQSNNNREKFCKATWGRNLESNQRTHSLFFDAVFLHSKSRLFHFITKHSNKFSNIIWFWEFFHKSTAWTVALAARQITGLS